MPEMVSSSPAAAGALCCSTLPHASSDVSSACTLAFIRAIHEYAAQHPRKLIEAHHAAQPHRADTIAIRTTPGKSSDVPVTVMGYELDPDNGRPTDTPADHSVEHFDSFAAERTVTRPLGYLIPPAPGNESRHDELLTTLHLHGIKTQRFAGTATVEQYIIDAIDRPQRPFQGHHLNRIDATAHTTTLDLPEGTIFIPTDQVLGALIVLLLEPESEDGLAAWNFLDAHMELGKPYPILRVIDRSGLSGQ